MTKISLQEYLKSWCESLIGRRVTIITQTLDRIRLCLEQDSRVAELRDTQKSSS